MATARQQMNKYQTGVTDTKNLGPKRGEQVCVSVLYPLQRKLQYGWNDGERS